MEYWGGGGKEYVGPPSQIIGGWGRAWPPCHPLPLKLLGVGGGPGLPATPPPFLRLCCHKKPFHRVFQMTPLNGIFTDDTMTTCCCFIFSFSCEMLRRSRKSFHKNIHKNFKISSAIGVHRATHFRPTCTCDLSSI